MQKEIKRLSDAEIEIMQVIWNTGEPVTSSAIRTKLRGRRDWSLPALMTALSRLVDKGFVYCDRSTRTNLYSALIGEQEYKQKESRSFLAKLYDSSLQNFVVSLYDAKALTEQDLSELRALIDTLERREDDAE